MLNSHHHLIDRLAFVNSLISGVALYPQVWSAVVYGGTDSLSVLTYTLILLNSLVWIMYSIHRALISLGIASILNAIASAILLIAIFIA